MTIPSKLQRIADSDFSVGDDLTKIKGIGPARQQWLKDNLEIFTFHDLSKMSADGLAAQLKAGEKLVSDNTIQGWIAQAQEFAVKPLVDDSQESASAEISSLTSDPIDQPKQDSDGKFQESDDAITEAMGNWTTLASFTLECQAKVVEGELKQRLVVRHLETGMADVGADLKDARTYQWMEQQLAPALPSPTTLETNAVDKLEITQADVDEKDDFLGSSVAIEILQIEISQPSVTEGPIICEADSKVAQGFIRSQDPFGLQIIFRLPRHTFDDSSHFSTTYQAQIYARNLTTGVTYTLGKSEPDTLVAGKFIYQTIVPDILIADSGVYRLQAIVTLQNTFSTPGYIEVPLIQVV